MEEKKYNNTENIHRSEKYRIIDSFKCAVGYYLPFYATLACLMAFAGCKKIIEIPPPSGTITTSQVFANSNQAESAVAGMYFQMINTTGTYSQEGMTLFAGMSADELKPFDQNFNDNYAQFQQDNILPTNILVGTNFWKNAFSVIYEANAVIEGIQTTNSVQDSTKNELIAEAKFTRAFNYFYLVNLFDGVPEVTTTNWRNTDLLARTSSADIYKTILADLIDAQNGLPATYPQTGERIRPTKWAASALLARVYLFNRDWQDAAKTATIVINNNALFGLLPDLNDVFLANSTEAIWQLKQNNQSGTFNATPEGAQLIPRVLNSNSAAPFAYTTPYLMSAFEPNDMRKIKWIDSTKYRNTKYFFPYKYKVGRAQATPGGAYSEYYMVLRLAEQYLIRAEAEAQLGDVADAAADLNIIRNRAGLPNTTASAQSDLLAAIAHENQVEFFAEWGHRWLDLKRSGQAAQVLSAEKGFPVSQNSLLYPIPQSELRTDPNLTQNPGY